MPEVLVRKVSKTREKALKTGREAAVLLRKGKELRYPQTTKNLRPGEKKTQGAHAGRKGTRTNHLETGSAARTRANPRRPRTRTLEACSEKPKQCGKGKNAHQ